MAMFASKTTLEITVGMTNCEYNTSQLKTLTDMQPICDISSGRFIADVARKIENKRLKLVEKRK